MRGRAVRIYGIMRGRVRRVYATMKGRATRVYGIIGGMRVYSRMRRRAMRA